MNKVDATSSHGRRGWLLFIFAVLALGAGVWLGRGPLASRAATGVASQEVRQLYTCGMHPQVIQDHPGNCPICGMTLTPVRKQAAADANAIAIDPVTAQNMGIRTGVVTKGPLRRTIRTVGVIDYDETAMVDVTTKYKGWIEKLYINATGQVVHRGEPLFEIYSPELYSAQTEYVLAVEDTTGALAGMKAQAITKLRYFDISDDQIATIEKSRHATKTLRIDAPRDGTVVEKMVVTGQMVDEGMKLYRIADLSMVWVQVQIFEQDLPFVRVGQEALVTLSYLPDREFRGRVTFVYPTVDEKTRTVRVRMEFHNPGYFLKPGMFATVRLTAELTPDALLAPDTAVLRSGGHDTVFVALDHGRFDPRTVTLGPRDEHDQYQILSGLRDGERIVTSGQFMLDSESQLREAIAKMSPIVPPQLSPTQTTAAATQTKTAPEPQSTPAAFVCPMPEHVAILYKHAGACPLCGMTLVPINADQLAHIVPGAAVDYYPCPMPEHADVRSAKPGNCPKCGMTLIPVMKAGQNLPVTNPPPAAVTLYRCPMAEHADVVSDRPGECPKCGMKLVETSTVKHGKTAEQHWRDKH